jgi:hypothetical protein
MPSFNLEKLQRLTEEQAMAANNLKDANDRMREIRGEMNRLHAILMANAGSPNAQVALSDKMKLPQSDLADMGAQGVLSYQVETNGEPRTYELNINIQTFNKFIHIRDQIMRLEGVVNERREHLARYAIVSSLRSAVGEWGFNTTEMGL